MTKLQQVIWPETSSRILDQNASSKMESGTFTKVLSACCVDKALELKVLILFCTSERYSIESEGGSFFKVEYEMWDKLML